jgi:hypothetical protein
MRLMSASSLQLFPLNTRALGLLLGQLYNADLELAFQLPSTGGLCYLDGISLQSVEALDTVLSDGGVVLESEGALSDLLARLGPEFATLLHHIGRTFWGRNESLMGYAISLYLRGAALNQ